MLSIPLEGALQALLQVNLRPPPGQLSKLGRVDELPVDLAMGLPVP